MTFQCLSLIFNFYFSGSPHLHGIFWFEGAPDVSNLENATEEYLQEVIDYFSKLVDATNPNINVDHPDIHPCRTSYSQVENFEKDLAQILLKVQRHTKCSNDYCYKINKRTNRRECRFN